MKSLELGFVVIRLLLDLLELNLNMLFLSINLMHLVLELCLFDSELLQLLLKHNVVPY